MFRSTLVLFFLCMMSPAWGQSWCANGSLNPTEQTICATPDLGWRDAQLEQAYAAVRHLSGVQSGQIAWISARNGCGWQVECIRVAYDSRIATLQGLAGGGGAGGGKPPSGQPAPLQPAHFPSWCHEDSLNAAERTICASADLAQMDLYMADLYRQVRNVPGASDSQRRWLTYRNSCRAEYTCLYDSYAGRIAFLRDQYGAN